MSESVVLEAAQKATYVLKKKAALLWYHNVPEIKMDEADFAAVFVAGEANAVKDQKGVVEWYFYGLKIVKASEVSSGN